MIAFMPALAGVAQQPAHTPAPAVSSSAMGTVPTRDALVTGGLEVRGESADLLSNASVTAYDHSATISLARGGDVLVCATSQFHLLHSGGGQSLLFGLDRGAFELHTEAAPEDVILTPDIRFTIEHGGRYDLRLRVTPDGDTCVNNVGTSSPVLMLSDPFSAATYRLIPGQHVLFERGDLHVVVDNEQSPCGCPQPVPAATELAATTPAARAAAEHPFPAAQSEGLAPMPPPANSPPASKQTQISTTFNYAEGAPPPPSTQPASTPPAAAGATSRSAAVAGAGGSDGATPPKTPPGAHDIAHAIGRFFHRLFHPKS